MWDLNYENFQTKFYSTVSFRATMDDVSKVLAEIKRKSEESKDWIGTFIPGRSRQSSHKIIFANSRGNPKVVAQVEIFTSNQIDKTQVVHWVQSQE